MKNSLIFTSIASAIIFLASCSTVKTLQATGGSKADGIVDLSYEYGMFESPEVQWDQGLIIAVQRCKAWGYTNAEPFGGSVSQCQRTNQYGNCLHYFVTTKYQCIGEQTNAAK